MNILKVAAPFVVGYLGKESNKKKKVFPIKMISAIF